MPQTKNKWTGLCKCPFKTPIGPNKSSKWQSLDIDGNNNCLHTPERVTFVAQCSLIVARAIELEENRNRFQHIPIQSTSLVFLLGLMQHLPTVQSQAFETRTLVYTYVQSMYVFNISRSHTHTVRAHLHKKCGAAGKPCRRRGIRRGLRVRCRFLRPRSPQCGPLKRWHLRMLNIVSYVCTYMHTYIHIHSASIVQGSAVMKGSFEVLIFMFFCFFTLKLLFSFSLNK